MDGTERQSEYIIALLKHNQQKLENIDDRLFSYGHHTNTAHPKHTEGMMPEMKEALEEFFKPYDKTICNVKNW